MMNDQTFPHLSLWAMPINNYFTEVPIKYALASLVIQSKYTFMNILNTLYILKLEYLRPILLYIQIYVFSICISYAENIKSIDLFSLYSINIHAIPCYPTYSMQAISCGECVLYTLYLSYIFSIYIYIYRPYTFPCISLLGLFSLRINGSKNTTVQT